MLSLFRRHLMLFAVSACSIGVGIGISSITSAGAASKTKASHAGKSLRHGRKLRQGVARAGLRDLRMLAHGAVEGDAVVDTKNGFVTVSFERGVVQSVSGQQLTMTEQTKSATYKTVTLTIPTDAVIRDDRAVGTITSLTQGQNVLVFTGVQRTLVIARTAKG